MSSQEYAAEQAESAKSAQRVVEMEIKLPKFEDLTLPKVDLEPVRAIAEQVLLTGLGAGVLLVRGLVSVVKAANEAGVEVARNPGPFTKALLSLVHTEKAAPAAGTSPAEAEVSVQVPILPIDNYDALGSDEVVGRLSGLPLEQVHIVREYEVAHQNRAQVLEAITQRLAAA